MMLWNHMNSLLNMEILVYLQNSFKYKRISPNILGEAYDEVKEKAGHWTERYNVQIKIIWNEEMGEGFKEIVDKFVELGILKENGDGCYTKGKGSLIYWETLNCRNIMVGNAGLSEWIKITEEEKIAMENDYDPIEAPPGPYTIQPDVPGKYCETEQYCINK